MYTMHANSRQTTYSGWDAACEEQGGGRGRTGAGAVLHCFITLTLPPCYCFHSLGLAPLSFLSFPLPCLPFSHSLVPASLSLTPSYLPPFHSLTPLPSLPLPLSWGQDTNAAKSRPSHAAFLAASEKKKEQIIYKVNFLSFLYRS